MYLDIRGLIICVLTILKWLSFYWDLHCRVCIATHIRQLNNKSSVVNWSDDHFSKMLGYILMLGGSSTDWGFECICSSLLFLCKIFDRFLQVDTDTFLFNSASCFQLLLLDYEVLSMMISRKSCFFGLVCVDL